MSQPTDVCLSPELEALGPHDVHLWLVDLEAPIAPARLEQLARLLSTEEAARRKRFRFEKLRHDFLLSRVLVRTTLSRYARVAPAEWQFVANRWGRPEIESPQLPRPLRFNLSHTRGLAACAVCWEHDLGVDVEALERRNATQQIAERFFAPAEVAELRTYPAAEQGRRFFDYWTLKESYIKARGMGLAIPLDQFAFCTRTAPEVTIAFTPPLDDDPAAWQFFQDSPTPRHRLALGIHLPRSAQPRVQSRWISLATD